MPTLLPWLTMQCSQCGLGAPLLKAQKLLDALSSIRHSGIAHTKPIEFTMADSIRTHALLFCLAITMTLCLAAGCGDDDAHGDR